MKRIVIEVRNFKEEEYDFYNEKNDHIVGTKLMATLDGGFVLKFKNKEDMNEVKTSKEDDIICTIDKFGRLRKKAITPNKSKGDEN